MERLDDGSERVGGLDQQPNVDANGAGPWPDFNPPKTGEQLRMERIESHIRYGVRPQVEDQDAEGPQPIPPKEP